jgi:hypothetical protein
LVVSKLGFLYIGPDTYVVCSQHDPSDQRRGEIQNLNFLPPQTTNMATLAKYDMKIIFKNDDLAKGCLHRDLYGFNYNIEFCLDLITIVL